MGLFDRLGSLVKKEQTEEDKLILDLQEAVRYLLKSSNIIDERIYLGKLPVTRPLLETKRGKISCFEFLNNAVYWLNEAQQRASVIINNLEQQKQVTDYRKKIELGKGQEESLTFLLNLETFMIKSIESLKIISNRVRAWTRVSYFDNVLEEAIHEIREMRINFKTSIKQLKAIKKKQNH